MRLWKPELKKREHPIEWYLKSCIKLQPPKKQGTISKYIGQACKTNHSVGWQA